MHEGCGSKSKLIIQCLIDLYPQIDTRKIWCGIQDKREKPPFLSYPFYITLSNRIMDVLPFLLI